MGHHEVGPAVDQGSERSSFNKGEEGGVHQCNWEDPSRPYGLWPGTFKWDPPKKRSRSLGWLPRGPCPSTVMDHMAIRRSSCISVSNRSAKPLMHSSSTSKYKEENKPKQNDLRMTQGKFGWYFKKTESHNHLRIQYLMQGLFG